MYAPPRPGLVFDRERAGCPELDEVGFAPNPQAFGPKRDIAGGADAGGDRISARIDTLMRELAANREEVLLERLLKVDQSTLPRTVAKVFDRRDGDIEKLFRVHG